MRSRVLLMPVFLSLFLLPVCSCAKPDGPTPEEATRIHVGETAPDFSLKTLSGEEFSLAAARGEVVLISFFATWCPPCREELPLLEQEVWQQLKSPAFRLLAIGREETPEKLRPFVEKIGLSFPVGADPDRSIYSKYAEAYIPRLFLVGRDGKVLFESSDFEVHEFARMKSILEKALDDSGPDNPGGLGEKL